ncbi:hypothetical protein CLV58_14724 [Spirosoma oryzae]|uniref:Uncharacterized protein n=1 Tax=Spirosoma oryzae TaxID=1469603 RepID=A0A2T0RLK6_9BACT|nr:hypothetical protein CLV58_14724 [Spirosoma oryzae]
MLVWAVASAKIASCIGILLPDAHPGFPLLPNMNLVIAKPVQVASFVTSRQASAGKQAIGTRIVSAPAKDGVACT